jgi:hypothetical protein
MSSVPGLYGVTLATNILSYSVVLAPARTFDGAATAVDDHCVALAALHRQPTAEMRRSMVPLRSSAES